MTHEFYIIHKKFNDCIAYDNGDWYLVSLENISAHGQNCLWTEKKACEGFKDYIISENPDLAGELEVKKIKITVEV